MEKDSTSIGLGIGISRFPELMYWERYGWIGASLQNSEKMSITISKCIQIACSTVQSLKVSVYKHGNHQRFTLEKLESVRKEPFGI